MPDIEGVPYEAIGGKIDQVTAQALAARLREAVSAGVGSVEGSLEDAKKYADSLFERTPTKFVGPEHESFESLEPGLWYVAQSKYARNLGLPVEDHGFLIVHHYGPGDSGKTGGAWFFPRLTATVWVRSRNDSVWEDWKGQESADSIHDRVIESLGEGVTLLPEDDVDTLAPGPDYWVVSASTSEALGLPGSAHGVLKVYRGASERGMTLFITRTTPVTIWSKTYTTGGRPTGDWVQIAGARESEENPATPAGTENMMRLNALDARLTGAGWRPSTSTDSRLTVWGSSSALQMTEWALKGLGDQMGVTVVNEAKGGEDSSQIAARLGAIPARITVPDNTIPASGSVVVTSSNMRTRRFLKPFTGWLCGVHGEISSDDSEITFTRTAPGDPVPCPPDSVFIPEAGSREASSMTILWMGKNDTPGEEEKTITRVDACAEYASGPQDRVLVLGHFVNYETSPEQVKKVLDLNATHKATYGDRYLDFQDWLMSDQVWEDTDITPTDEDRQAQAAGQLAPSLQKDAGHMSWYVHQAGARRVHKKLAELGWVAAPQD